jgi:hypothetical protein
MWGGIFVIEFNHFICKVANLSDFVTLCKLAFWLNVVTLDMKWHIIWLNLIIYGCSITSMEEIKLNNLIINFLCVMEPLSLDQLILLNSNHQPPLGVLTHPELLYRLNCESKGEDNGRRRSWGALLSSQHFGGRRACWNFGMGLGILTSTSLTHMDLHKPNNKLVTV